MKSEEVRSKNPDCLRIRDFWRRRRDSNPRPSRGIMISSHVRYDHFDTSPCKLPCYYNKFRCKCQGKNNSVCKHNYSFRKSDLMNSEEVISKPQRHMPLGLWWERVDSNHRSRRQQIYSLPPLATREHSHIKF